MSSSGFYLVSGFMHLNMACQIIFVLANRMKAQNVDMKAVGSRILCDVTHMMFKASFIDSLLKPQTPFTVPTLYQIFNKMVNCSMMKLDKNSMEKLFYLVLMTFKRQLFLLSSPLELYTLTVSHLEDVGQLQKSNPSAIQCIKQALQIFKANAQKFTFINYLDLKQQMLSMFECYKSKIVLFCEIGSQDDSGCMIFTPRNAHNRKAIGMAQNHQSIDFPDLKNTNNIKNLQYSNYRTWKTNLGKDDYDNVRGSSKILQSKVKSKKSLEQDSKELKDILGIKNMKLDTYEVHIDIFASDNPTQPTSSISTATQPNKKTQNNIKIAETKQQNQIKKKIDAQFDNLAIGGKKEEQGSDEIDLLELMDS